MSETESQEFVAMIAVDKSKHSEFAFDYYCKYIHRPCNKVYLVHVAEGPTTTSVVQKHMNINVEEWQKLMEKETQETEQLLNKYQDRLDKEKISGVYKAFYGKPGEALCTAALELQARLVVIGTRGLGSVRRTILGSVSDYLVHHAHASVVVCRHKP